MPQVKKLGGIDRDTEAELAKLKAPQIRVLKTLAEAKGSLNRRKIAERSDIDVMYLTECLGSLDPAQNEKTQLRTKFKTLIGWGFATAEKLDIDGVEETVHNITAKGREALEELQEAN